MEVLIGHIVTLQLRKSLLVFSGKTPMTKRALQRTKRVVHVIGLSNSNSETHRSIRPLSESNPVPPDSKTTLPPTAPPPLIEYGVWKLS
ncbi:hypothetical protein EVAR_79891_1 [Eumeta japonica]|uniref:Uncharacterized protein n=1 Tax=Eumeta variegata TaxID=151549 RepID=A0A4C1TYY7_EUMVA|nr:hypothetical protein EVAR_79891_1 [Eumeta japonica]